MKKTLLTLLLMLCMLVTFTAFTASAEETETAAAHANHCVCGGSAVGVGDHTTCTDVEWTPLSQALSAKGMTMQTADFGRLSSGNYYLDGDVTVANDTYFTKQQQINICLNGHSISVNALGTDGKAQGAFGYIQAGANISICDCSGVQDAQGNWSWDGTITGGTRLYGGVLATNANARAYIYGGNYVGVSGTSGVVFNVSKDGYAVAGGNSTDKQETPGLYSELYIYNGNMTGGNASNAGGVINVWHSSDVTIYGGTITGGTASNRGGAICFANGNYLIAGGTITGGTATKEGDVIYVPATASVTIRGDVTIGDVYVAAGADFTMDERKDTVGISTAHKDHCVCADHAEGMGTHTCETLQWEPWGFVESERTSLPTAGGNYYLVSDISLTASKNVPSKDLAVSTQVNLCLNNHTISLSKSGRINVRATLSITDCGTKGKIVSTSKGSFGGIFYVYNGAKLSTYAGTYDASKSAIGDGGVAHIGDSAKAYMDIYGGTFYGANLTNEGYTPSTNLRATRGGVLNITINSVVNMYGGTMTGGTATITVVSGNSPMGGCVSIFLGTFNMYGGSITGGKAHSVYLRSNSGCYLTVGADAEIDNLYVGANKTFTTREDFTGSIGVTTSTKGYAFTTVADAAQAQCFTSKEAGYSTKHNASLKMYVDAHEAHCECGGKAVGMGEHSCAVVNWMPWGYLSAEKTSLPETSGNYYLVSDVNVSALTDMSASLDINICLNGHNITGTGTTRIWSVRGQFGLTDCTETAGTVSASATGNYGGIFFIYQDAQADLYAGTLDASKGNVAQGGVALIGNTAGGTMNIYNATLIGGTLNTTLGKECRGGALYLIANSTVNMYGGSITGGTAAVGGTVYVLKGCAFNAYGGAITGGTAQYGGSIYIASGGKAVLSNAQISGGTAYSATGEVKGGNIYTAAAIEITDCTISGGTAESGDGIAYGGNIYNAATIEMEDCYIIDGTAHSNASNAYGGNIYGDSNVEMTDCTITGGQAASGVTAEDGTFTPGKATYGGNICAIKALTMTGCEVADGAAVHGGNIRADGTTDLTGCTISNGCANLMCDGTTNGNGGNLYSASEAVTTITDCTFVGGAAQRGGSIGAWGKVTIEDTTIEDTTITDGYAGVSGGNLMTYNNGYATLRGTTVISGGTANGDGGNIRFSSAATKTNTIEDGVQIGAGTAKERGDCICLSGGTLKLMGNPVIAGIYAVNTDAAYGMDVSELNCTQPIVLQLSQMGEFAISTSDKSSMFIMQSNLEEVRYDSAAQQLFTAWVEQTHVYVDAINGSDENLGTQDAPVKTTARAMNATKDNGTIHLVGTVELGTWSKHSNIKTYTFTGGELVMPKYRTYLYDNVIFDNVTVTLPQCDDSTDSNFGQYFFYCDGFTTVFKENVTVRYLYNGSYFSDPYHQIGTKTDSEGKEVKIYGNSTLYGGGPSAFGTVSQTNLTVLTGCWGAVYGGPNGVDMVGDVHLTVGGNINEDVDYVSHSHSSWHIILGGGRNADIDGTVYMNIIGGTHVSTHGGGSGTNTIGAIELTVTDGIGMALYAGGRGGTQTVTNGITFRYQGGTFEQVFGGNLSSDLVANVNAYITGGNITRRLYGGSYSNLDESSGKWTADHFTTGTINLMIGIGANISCDLKDPNPGWESIFTGGKYSDRGIYAHSRRAKPSATDAEIANLIFLDEAAYNENKGNLTAQDTIMSGFMNGISAADVICYLSWSADDTADIIYANATAVQDPETKTTGDASAISATASLTLGEAPFYYNGATVEPATVVLSSNWHYGAPTLTYTGNDAIGTATATMTANNLTVNKTFQIVDGTVTVLVNGQSKSFYSMQKAFDAAGENGLLKLTADCDQNVTVSNKLYLDLNGYSITGTVTVGEGATLYGMDSTTDDYDCTDGNGTIKVQLLGQGETAGKVAVHHKTSVTGKVRRYLTYTEADGTLSFHRIYLGVTSMSLRPSVKGVGYKATFRADSKALALLDKDDAFGYTLWVEDSQKNLIGTATRGLPKAKFTNEGTVALRLENFDAVNFGEHSIYATVYLKLANGDVITSSEYVYTLRSMIEKIDSETGTYSPTQMQALQDMLSGCADALTTAGWAISNIMNWSAPTVQ